MTLMCISLNDVKCTPKGAPSNRTIKHMNPMRLMIVSVRNAWQWWVEEDLNLRPHAYQACALTT